MFQISRPDGQVRLRIASQDVLVVGVLRKIFPELFAGLWPIFRIEGSSARNERSIRQDTLADIMPSDGARAKHSHQAD